MRGLLLALAACVALSAGAQVPRNVPVTVHGRDVSEPAGYLGIVFTAPLARTVHGGSISVRHFAYPVVESVEPGSPAAQAGISAGDTILAYDSVDVMHHEIALTRLLRPGAVVTVRVRRNGAVRDVGVRVAPRPASFVDGDMAMHSPDVAMLMPFQSATVGVAGAAVITTNADLLAALGAPRGVLVIDVAEGTPAEASGLKAGDVITDAGGTAVTRPVALMQAIEESSGHQLDLTVVRARHARKVSLSW
ncbi:MAG TPA: PDZ domain-containing protein [Gemmatimonadaceae bacterium]|jgi:S1-C subfamily serine protease|nr:PDZ domain-containing protein [Gemmatimonadaceae bacterium]